MAGWTLSVQERLKPILLAIIRVITDLSEVNFLASIGIRLLMMNAKSIAALGGKVVLLSPSPEVKSVLEITGIPAIIPIYDGYESAEEVLLA